MARVLFVLALLLVGCVDTGPGPQGKKIDPTYVSDNLVKQVPSDITQVGVALGGKVVYAGNKVDRAALVPGQPVRITHYWQVTAPVGPGWRVFAFVRGDPATADFMNLGATDMELGHPPDKWKQGEIIQDVQDIVLRPDWRSTSATLYVGLIQVGGHDLGDRMAASGPNVIDRAVVARAMPIDLSRAPPPPGTVYVPHATGAIVIDGVANEPGWAGAVASPEFATAEGSPEPVGHATARMTWDEQYLYVFVQVIDTDIYSQYKQHDDPLWKQDAVELFIDADGNRHGYVELQVNPNNATFDSWFATTRAQPGDEKWDSGMVTAVKVRGTADQQGDTDQGWDVEIGIPWAAVKGRDEAMAVRLPPQVGDKWRLNVVRVDSKTGGGASASSWNRITYSDFHALDRMLTVVFADPTGLIVPQAPGATGSAAGSGSAATPALQTRALGSAAQLAPIGPVPVLPNAGSAATVPPSAGRAEAVRPAQTGSATAGSAVAPNPQPAGSAAPVPKAGSGAAAKPEAAKPSQPGSGAPRPLPVSVPNAP